MNNKITSKTDRSGILKNNFYLNPNINIGSASNFSVKFNDDAYDDEGNKIESIDLLNSNKENDDDNPFPNVNYLNENTNNHIGNNHNYAVDLRSKVKSVLRSHKFHLVLVILVMIKIIFILYNSYHLILNLIKVIIESLFVACEVSCLVFELKVIFLERFYFIYVINFKSVISHYFYVCFCQTGAYIYISHKENKLIEFKF